MYNGKREGAFWIVWLGVMLLLIFCLDLPGQVVISSSLESVVPEISPLVGGINPPLVTVGLESAPGVLVPAYNAKIPLGQSVRFHINSLPEGVKTIHYSLQSLPGGCSQPCTIPNGKQELTPPSLSSNVFTPTKLGFDAIIVWYPHPDDPNALTNPNQLAAQQQRLPFVVVESVPTQPNSIIRVNNTFIATCSNWKLSTTLDMEMWPVTFGIQDLICIYSQTTGGTNVSCAFKTEPCFTPVTVLVP